MTPPVETPNTPAPPSLSLLAWTTLAAIVVAGLLLVTMVLPAEYGIDPLGTGRALGLTAIAAPPVEAAAPLPAEGAKLVPVQRGPIGEYPAEFKMDVYEVELGPYETVEYKYQFEQGGTMVFAWSASAPLMHDFHGERAKGLDGPAEESYDKETRRQSSGSFAAPFAGIHGWYWENPGDDPVTIRLTSSGFYSAAVEIQADRTHKPRTLRALETLTPIVDTAAEPRSTP